MILDVYSHVLMDKTEAAPDELPPKWYDLSVLGGPNPKWESARETWRSRVVSWIGGLLLIGLVVGVPLLLFSHL